MGDLVPPSQPQPGNFGMDQQQEQEQPGGAPQTPDQFEQPEAPPEALQPPPPAPEGPMQ
jgi:hypothetical protein